MNSSLEQAGLDATERFITTWNSRDPQAWAESLHYPHVRPASTGEIRVAADIDTYIRSVDYQPVIDAGWDHSEWDYRHVLHANPEKIHVAGQWSRYTAGGEIILTTPIVYICTNIDGLWGIQSRFAADYVDEDTDTTGLMTRALNLVQDFVNHANNRNTGACAELLNYPHFSVNPGKLDITENTGDFELPPFTLQVNSLQALQTGLRSINAAVEMIATTPTGQRRLEGVIHINNRDNHLGIQAWSLLDPDLHEE